MFIPNKKQYNELTSAEKFLLATFMICISNG